MGIRDSLDRLGRSFSQGDRGIDSLDEQDFQLLPCPIPFPLLFQQGGFLFLLLFVPLFDATLQEPEAEPCDSRRDSHGNQQGRDKL